MLTINATILTKNGNQAQVTIDVADNATAADMVEAAKAAYMRQTTGFRRLSDVKHVSIGFTL